MTELQILDIGGDAIFTLLLILAPVLGVALAVSIAISLFQALTQMQEMTLSFVPKIVAVFLALTLFMPFMLNTLIAFSERQFELIGGY